MLARVEVALAILFMVSGFLIYRPFAGRYLADRPDDFKTYFKKRVGAHLPRLLVRAARGVVPLRDVARAALARLR